MATGLSWWQEVLRTHRNPVTESSHWDSLTFQESQFDLESMPVSGTDALLTALWIYLHLILDIPGLNLQGASETTVKLLKGENILTGPKMVYSIFVEPLESLLFLYDRLKFSKGSFSIHCSRKGNKHVHIKEELPTQWNLIQITKMELRQAKTAKDSQEDLGPSHVAQDKRHESTILKKITS